MFEPIRVTEVINYFSEPWKLDWYAKNGKAYCNKVGKAAMKVGSRVDELIKEYPAAPFAETSDKAEVVNCVKAYNKWWEVYRTKSITHCTRLKAIIEGHEVTVEPDLMVDDVLVDLKCSSKISLQYWIQVNMYRYLEVRKQFPDTPFPADEYADALRRSKVGILRLDKTTSSYEYVVKDYDVNCVNVWCGMMRAMVYYKGDSHDGDEL